VQHIPLSVGNGVNIAEQGISIPFHMQYLSMAVNPFCCQFQQDFTRKYYFAKKLQSQTVIREKLC